MRQEGGWVRLKKNVSCALRRAILCTTMGTAVDAFMLHGLPISSIFPESTVTVTASKEILWVVRFKRPPLQTSGTSSYNALGGRLVAPRR